MTTLHNLLKEYRTERSFDVEKYVAAKVGAIREHFQKHGLQAAVLGVSGGVDSAIVNHLLIEALGPSNVYAMSLPIFGSIGSTGQQEAATMAYQAFPGIVVKNLSDMSAVANNTVGSRNSFTVGQVDYWLRPVVLYGMAARLQSANIKAVVVGTINRDEGSYIGYFGKHTDICDIQIISDLHKSEVYQVAKHYGVLDAIINRAPEGNVHDGKTDEEMIGTSYDMVELFTGYYLYNLDKFDTLLEEEKLKWDVADAAISKRRSENYFKYHNGLSCYFIDVLDRTVPGGWK